MNETTITITVEEYIELLKASVKIEILEQMTKEGRVYDSDVKSVLGIREEKEE